MTALVRFSGIFALVIGFLALLWINNGPKLVHGFLMLTRNHLVVGAALTLLVITLTVIQERE